MTETPTETPTEPAVVYRRHRTRLDPNRFQLESLPQQVGGGPCGL